MRFSGTLDELKAQLHNVEDCEWIEDNSNQIQIRHGSGGVMNWYPSTGTINFQGKAEGRKHFEEIISSVLFGSQIESSNVSNIILQVDNLTQDQELEASNILANEDPEDKGTILNPEDSELVIGLVGAVGSRLPEIIEVFKQLLTNHFNYNVEVISVSKNVIAPLCQNKILTTSEYERINSSMDAGNYLRENSGDNSFLALSVVELINELRKSSSNGHFRARTVYIVSSLKHPEEVLRLRQIYNNGFFLVSVYEDLISRSKYLKDIKNIDPVLVQTLIKRDENESADHGQHTSEVFHMADYFLRLNDSAQRLANDCRRFLDLIFGNPYITPTFDEYANFMAFSSALRSADLSRQVGAVVAKDKTILSTGANDVPKFGGGLYWPYYDEDQQKVVDYPNGRDFINGFDPNVFSKEEIVTDILEKMPDQIRAEAEQAIRKSKLKDITEYGRSVHAEMEALLACARGNISTKSTTLYTTTFPCHNCAKHIIAAGVERVVFVEPYPKSKALDFHSEAVSLGFSDYQTKLIFEPFVGIGPRRFFDLFSIHLGSGYPITRKYKDGTIVEWSPSSAQLRLQMIPHSYLERENQAVSIVNRLKTKIQNHS